MATLGVVLDGVARAQTDPLGDRTVLLELLGKNLLGAEGLVRRLLKKQGKEGSSACLSL